MRRTLFIVIALITICTGSAQAQRYLPKMQGLELRGGGVDGFNNTNNFLVELHYQPTINTKIDGSQSIYRRSMTTKLSLSPKLNLQPKEVTT